LQLGNGRYETTQFNSRLQPTQIGLGTSTTDTSLLKLNYDYGTTDDNGNVKTQTITVPGMTYPLIQTYAYDTLNRLKSAEEKSNGTTTWKQTFLYDRYGNRNFDVANTTTLGSCSQAQCNPTISSTNNRFASGQGYSYDLAGNTTTDAEGRQFTYDAENKQTQVKDVNNSVVGTYSYDGDGKRVKKAATTENIVFVYDAVDSLIEEYSGSSLQTSYVYAGNRLMTTETLTSTNYLTNDNLSSPRINTDTSGNVTARHDYMPFGEEIFNVGGRTAGLGYGSDNVRNKFASYERDSETNLDFAQKRLYENSQGRFTTPDPYNVIFAVKDSRGKKEGQQLLTLYIQQPQNWNRYAYVLNNPTVFVDPDGELWMKIGNNQVQWVDKCPEKTTCYEILVYFNSNQIQIFGSRDASDITYYQANKNGQIDLNELSQHHDANFFVAKDQVIPEEFLSTNAAAALFQGAYSYGRDHPGDSKLEFTAGDQSNGKGCVYANGKSCHATHDGGNAIDLRYMDKNGNPIKDPNAYNLADPDRMKSLIAQFNSNGFNAVYTGNQSKFGLNQISSRTAGIHRNHVHFANNRPSTVPQAKR